MPRRSQTITVVALALALGLWVGTAYVRAHPASMGSLIVQSSGILWLEPTYVDRQPGVELLPGLHSYESVENVRALLRARGIEWQEADGDPTPAADRRLPFVMYGLDLLDHEHLGSRGRLSLSFFNDRLDAAIFYPTDVDAYLAAVEQHEGYSLSDDRDAFPAAYTRVWVFTDWHGRRYVGREDVRLREEESSWVMKYS